MGIMCAFGTLHMCEDVDPATDREEDPTQIVLTPLLSRVLSSQPSSVLT